MLATGAQPRSGAILKLGFAAWTIFQTEHVETTPGELGHQPAQSEVIRIPKLIAATT
jgi:hypothetical protein